MDDLAEKTEGRLKPWNWRFEELAARVDEAGAVDYRKCIRDLKNKCAAAQAKLDEFKAQGEEKWECLRTDIWSAWNESG